MTLSSYYVGIKCGYSQMSWDEIHLSNFLIWSDCLFVVTWHKLCSLSPGLIAGPFDTTHLTRNTSFLQLNGGARTQELTVNVSRESSLFEKKKKNDDTHAHPVM